MANVETSLILKLIDKFSGPASNAQAALSKIQNSAGNLKNFIKLRRETLAVSAAYETAQLEVRQLANQLKSTQNPSKQLTSEFNKAKNKSRALKNQLGEQNTALILLRSSLKSAGVSTRNLTAKPF